MNKTPPPQTIESHAETGNTFEVTPNLRWYAENLLALTLNAQRLQQAWVCRETGEVSWKDVPLEVPPVS